VPLYPNGLAGKNIGTHSARGMFSKCSGFFGLKWIQSD
jgi:hypothetical protein